MSGSFPTQTGRKEITVLHVPVQQMQEGQIGILWVTMRKHEKILIHVLLLLGILSSYCSRILLSKSQFSLVPGSMYRVGVGVSRAVPTCRVEYLNQPKPQLDRGGAHKALPLTKKQWQLMGAGEGTVHSLLRGSPWQSTHTPINASAPTHAQACLKWTQWA